MRKILKGISMLNVEKLRNIFHSQFSPQNEIFKKFFTESCGVIINILFFYDSHIEIFAPWPWVNRIFALLEGLVFIKEISRRPGNYYLIQIMQWIYKNYNLNEAWEETFNVKNHQGRDCINTQTESNFGCQIN